jgi:hypothetical protein
MTDFVMVNKPEKEEWYTLSGVAHCTACGKTRGTGEVLQGVPCECGYTPKALHPLSTKKELEIVKD